MAGKAAFLGLLAVVDGDIPVHCQLKDFAGHWEFSLGEVGINVPARFPQDLGEKFCFHNAPNTNIENLNLFNQKHQWPEMMGSLDKVEVLLTNDQSEQDGTIFHSHKLLVKSPADGKTILGSWTPIYDEGFEIHIGDKKLFAFAGYDCAENKQDSQTETLMNSFIERSASTGANRTNAVAIGSDGDFSTEVITDGQEESHYYSDDRAQSPHIVDRSLSAGGVGAVRSMISRAFQAGTLTSLIETTQKQCGRPGAQEGKDARLPTGYSSLCGQTNIGWYRKETANPSGEVPGLEGYGCWFAEKKASKDKSAVSSFVVLNEHKGRQLKSNSRIFHKSHFKQGKLPSYRKTLAIDALDTLQKSDAFVQLMDKSQENGENRRLLRGKDASRRSNATNFFDALSDISGTTSATISEGLKSLIQSGEHSKKDYNERSIEAKAVEPVDEVTTLQDSDPKQDACNLDRRTESYADFVKLPKHFDWRDAKGWDSAVINQGDCGSCYAIAGVYSLEARFNIALMQAGIKNKRPVNLSYKDPMSCSYYNQHCAGGYPELIGKHAYEMGVPSVQKSESENDSTSLLQNADKEDSGDDTDSTDSSSEKGSGFTKADASFLQEDAVSCNKAAYQDPNRLFYAKDYGYIGGFYGKCSEARMMEEILHRGPIAVAIESDDSFSEFVSKEVQNKHHQGSNDRSQVYVQYSAPKKIAELISTHLMQQQSLANVDQPSAGQEPSTSNLDIASNATIDEDISNDSGLVADTDKVQVVSTTPGSTEGWVTSLVVVPGSFFEESQYPGEQFVKKIMKEADENSATSFIEKGQAVHRGVDEIPKLSLTSEELLQILLHEPTADPSSFLEVGSKASNAERHRDVAAELTRLDAADKIKVEKLTEKSVNDWEYVDHAVVVVGWGESDDDKYWVVRNSWGGNWGPKSEGYAYIRRGDNHMAIEAQTIFIDPDFTRGAGAQILADSNLSIVQFDQKIKDKHMTEKRLD